MKYPKTKLQHEPQIVDTHRGEPTIWLTRIDPGFPSFLVPGVRFVYARTKFEAYRKAIRLYRELLARGVQLRLQGKP